MCIPSSIGMTKNNNKENDFAQRKTATTISSAPILEEDEMFIVKTESFEHGGDTDTVQPCIVGGYTGEGKLPAPAPRIHGYLKWFDDSGYIHPLQFITVNIIDKADGSLVATVQTNENGYYSFLTSVARQIYIQAFARGAGVEVYTATGVYSFESPDYAYSGSTSLEISYTIDMETTCGQAFQISQALIAAARYAKEMNDGNALPDVYVVYPHNNSAQTVSYYQYMGDEYQTGMIFVHGVRKTDVSVIDIDFFDDYENWDTLMHEYGHHVSQFLNVNDSPGGNHSFGEDLIASRGEYDGARLAWSEAYATVFGQMAQEYYAESLTNILGLADAKYGMSDDNQIENLKDGYKKGEGSEMATVSMLYDLYDSQNDGMDYIFFGHQMFWDYIKNSNAVRFSQFVDYLYTEELVDIDLLGRNLGEHGFVASNFEWTGGPKFMWDASSYTEMTDPHVYSRCTITFKNAAGEVIHSRVCIYNYCEISTQLFDSIKEHGIVYITLEERYANVPDSPYYISQTFVVNFNAT